MAMLSREAAEIDRDFVTALKTDRRATIQWSSSDPTTEFISEAPNPARNLALNLYSVVAHERHGVVFVATKTTRQYSIKWAAPDPQENNYA